MNSKLFPSWVDGRIIPAGEPALSADDQGFQLGLAVFDTLIQERGCRYFEEDHLERLARGASSLGLPWPPPHSPATALEELSSALGGIDCILRLTYSRGIPGGGPTLVVSAREAVALPAEGVVVALESGAKLVGHRLEAVKATSRLRNVLAREKAQREGAFESLLCTDEGDVAEGTISNVFAVLDGKLVTPALERGVLAGITRERLIQDLQWSGEACLETRVETADLERADEIFLTNTTHRILPVRAILGLEREFPGRQGEVTCAVIERFFRLEERYRSNSRE